MSPLEYTPIDEIPKIFTELKRGFGSGKTESIQYRKEQLLQLGYLVKDNLDRFRKALYADLHRPPIETDLFDLSIVIQDVKNAYNNIDKWTRTERAPFHFNWFAMKPSIRKEPKGVVLIIAPYNYPIFLLFGPLIGAIAAGNGAVLKPSEMTPETSALIAELLPQYLDPELYRVINGGIPETTKILELPWNHILYTGNGRVAKIVLQAAAKHLTPVSTELGGKCPVIIDENCDLKTSARRIMASKVANSGQTCVAPDYVLVPRHFQDQLVEAFKETLDKFYPNTDPVRSDSYARIVSPQHTQRIKRLIDETRGEVVVGGQADVEQRYIAPTIVKNVPEDDSLMSEEIFGPVLPIVPVGDIDEAIAFVNERDHPLALYLFSKDEKVKAKVLENTQSGGVAVNDCVMHVGAYGTPFGGIGPSGSGYHTGKFSFDMFTHLRVTIDSPSWLDKILSGRFPPYTEKKFKTLSKLLYPSLPPRPGTKRSNSAWIVWAVAALAVVSGAVLAKPALRERLGL
ncbi:NAD-aldehyde dehydrogenase [Obba rivulosa]|uniref:Aldehyde dehydrogenase n=1 Tax=Obba rivulosa TaxID=1052685 RepID=A0A8E2DP50_9APHY|nr:NAD-aldehyde dehydrogenase [Obba rivulosa]